MPGLLPLQVNAITRGFGGIRHELRRAHRLSRQPPVRYAPREMSELVFCIKVGQGEPGKVRLARMPTQIQAQAGLRHTATIDFPTVYQKSRSVIRDRGTRTESQNASCFFVGMDCFSSSRFAVEAARPTESR